MARWSTLAPTGGPARAPATGVARRITLQTRQTDAQQWLLCAVTLDGSGGGSFALDGKATLLWQCRRLVSPEEAAKGRLVWAWVRLTWPGSGGVPVLAPGTHLLTLRGVSAADGDLLLDRLIVTDDEAYVPE